MTPPPPHATIERSRNGTVTLNARAPNWGMATGTLLLDTTLCLAGRNATVTTRESSGRRGCRSYATVARGETERRVALDALVDVVPPRDVMTDCRRPEKDRRRDPLPLPAIAASLTGVNGVYVELSKPAPSEYGEMP